MVSQFSETYVKKRTVSVPEKGISNRLKIHKNQMRN